MEYHNYVIAIEKKNIYLKLRIVFLLIILMQQKKIQLLLKTMEDYTITEKMTIFDDLEQRKLMQ